MEEDIKTVDIENVQLVIEDGDSDDIHDDENGE